MLIIVIISMLLGFPPAQSLILLMKRLYWERIILGDKTLEIARCRRPP